MAFGGSPSYNYQTYAVSPAPSPSKTRKTTPLGLSRSETSPGGSGSTGSPGRRRPTGIPRTISSDSNSSPGPSGVSPRATPSRDVSGSRMGSATPTNRAAAGDGAGDEARGLGINMMGPSRSTDSPGTADSTPSKSSAASSRIPRAGSSRTPTQARPGPGSLSTSPSKTRTAGMPSPRSSKDGSPIRTSPNRTPTAVVRPNHDSHWPTSPSSSSMDRGPSKSPNEVMLGNADSEEVEEMLTTEEPPYSLDDGALEGAKNDNRLSTSSLSSVSSTPSSSSNRSRRLSSPAQKSAGPRRKPRNSIISTKSVTSNESHWSERDDTIGDLAPSSSSAVPIPEARPPLTIQPPTHRDIPRRGSSTSTSSSASGHSPSMARSPPPISPRGSSREQAFTPPPAPATPPPLDAARRASRNIVLGESSMAPPPRPPIDARRRPSHHVDVSELFGPTPPPGFSRRGGTSRTGGEDGGKTFPLSAADRRNRTDGNGSSTRGTPSGSGHSTPELGAGPGARRSNPNLRISTPPAASSSRFPLLSVSENSPPVPSKNPLRRASRPDLTAGADGSRPESVRSTSSSTFAAPPTPPPAEVLSGPRLRKRDSRESTYAAPPDSPISTMSHRSPQVSHPPNSVMLNSPASIAVSQMTMQSMYSQESLSQGSDTTAESNDAHDAIAPGWPSEAQEAHQQRGAKERKSYGWGRKRSREQPSTREKRQSASRKDLPPLQTSPRPSSSHLDTTPRKTPLSAASGSTITAISTETSLNGHAPSPAEDEADGPRGAMRSPSMPALQAAASISPLKPTRNLGVEGQVPLPSNRSATDPSASLAAPNLRRTPTSPGPSTPATPLSKRMHLIREIATTERAYANDLALIRDAYLSKLRPLSTVSTASTGERTSERSSTYTEGGAGSAGEMRRTSMQSLNGTWTGGPTTTTPGPSTPLPRSPSDSTTTLGTLGTGYFSLTKTPSRSSVNLSLTAPGMTTPGAISPRISMKGVPNPPTPPGKPLSTADLRAVFLNLEQLTAAAEDMAGEFEKAMGSGMALASDSEGREAREREKGDDKMGEVFMTLIPKYRQLYTFYCARQSTASVRLLQLQGDAGHAAHLKQCWNLVRPHTHAWNLDSMLIKPIQRITKYPLLFEDLLACTTPVHPDYFAIRNSAELARQVAVEIDEAKRRKDVVAGVIKKVPNTAPPKELKPLKPGRPKALKLFSKNKTNASSVSLASRASSNRTLVDDLPAEIPTSSLAFYRELVARLEEVDMCVRRVGKDMVIWTANAKEVFVAQENMVKTWARVVQLDESDPADKRLAAFRRVLSGVVQEHWGSLNDDVKDSIMPALARLLDTMYNPRKVISRRDAKAPDYSRYTASRDARRPIEPPLLESAREFVALHHQLVEELPAFLEGFVKIFDLTLASFARSQAAYFASVRASFDKFAQNWIGGISPRPPSSSVILLDDLASPTADEEDLNSARGIVKAWHVAWLPYDEAMRHFQTTSTARLTTNRNSKPSSRANSPGRPSLRHANSVSSQKSLRQPLSRSNTEQASARGTSADRRPRATSLLDQPPAVPPVPTADPVSPAATSNFKLVRTTSSPHKTLGVPGGGYATPPSPHTLDPLEAPQRPLFSAKAAALSDDRLSFGLPKLSPSADVILNPAEFTRSRPESAHGPTEEQAERIAEAHAAASGAVASADVRAERGERENVGLGLGEFGEKVDRLMSTPEMTHVRSRKQSQDIYVPRDYAADVPGSSGTVGTVHLSSDSDARPAPAPMADRAHRRSSTSTVSAQGSIDGLGSPVPIEDPGMRRNRRRSSDLHRSPRLSGASDRPVILTKEQRRASREEKRASRDERRRMDEYDAAEGWRNEAVLYQCAAVAEFDPKQYGDKRYRKLRFLPVRTGDLIDVFYEVGRVDELPSFPYTEIGVENDGVLVGRAENGDIGLVICSFLEPLI